MQVGDIVKRQAPSYGHDFMPLKGGKPEKSICIYIHPERRFYTVEFDFGPGGKFCESFSFR